MSQMINKALGFGLALLTKMASSDLLDQFKLSKWVEQSLYHSAKAGFKTLETTQKSFKSTQKLPQQRLTHQSKDLFDLSLSEEQQMLVDAMQQFATEVIYPLAHQVDHEAKFPQVLWQYSTDLGLNTYALPEALGGVATEQNIVSHILIAEQLARGDFCLSSGLLSTFGVMNAMTRWGSEQVQNQYLSAFAETDANHPTPLQATFAVQENTAAFNPYQLKTKATLQNGQYLITGEKTLVILAETADLFLVSAELNGQANVFIVQRDASIQFKAAPAMGLKSCETATLKFNQTPCGAFRYR